MTPVHATAVARHDPGGWRGVLLTGPSGAGKSDLALRLMGQGWRLVSDDYSRVWRSGGHVYATAPETIAGRIEARGLGIIGVPALPLARMVLVLVCGQETAERLPEADHVEIAGLTLPRLSIDTRPASAVEIAAAAMARTPL